MTQAQTQSQPAGNARIIRLPNRMLKKIGGIEAAKEAFGPDVLVRVQDAIDGQAEAFEGIIDQYIKRLNTVTIDKQPFDAGVIAEARSISHELRGISGTFGFHLITRVSKSLWDFLGDFNEPTPIVHNIVRMHVDTLLAAQATHGDGDAVALQVEKGLQSVIAKFRGAG